MMPCYNPLEQKMHNELGFSCEDGWHYSAPEVNTGE